MECNKCEYSCGCVETCKLKSSECYQNRLKKKQLDKYEISYKNEDTPQDKLRNSIKIK